MTSFNPESAKLTLAARVALREFAALFPTNTCSITNVVGALNTTKADAADGQLALKSARTVKLFPKKQGVQFILNVSTQPSRGSTSTVSPVTFVTVG